MTTPPTGVLVLGMHRSGTSLVTGLLSRLGLHLPSADALYAPTEFNPRGNQEVMELTATNERLMHAFGGEWSAPPVFGEGWRDDPRAASLLEPSRAAFARCFAQRPWIWKDPRLCLMLPFWEPFMATRPLVVHVVRNPLETADSLARRDDFHPAHSLALWECYQRGALLAATGRWVLTTTYENVLRDPAAWLQKARDELAGQGLQVGDPSAAAADFAEAKFRNSRYSAADLRDSAVVSPHQRALYEDSCALPEVSACFEPPSLPPLTPWAEALLAERRAGRAEVRALRARIARGLGPRGKAALRRALGKLRRPAED